MLLPAALSPLVPAPLYLPYCLALLALARRRLDRRGEVEGVPVYELAGGGAHDAIGIGLGNGGLILASRAAMADAAWPGLRAHLASHVRRRDGLRVSFVITTSVLLAAWQPWVLVPGALWLAWTARDAERHADLAAARAVRHDGDALAAFARYAAIDGARGRSLPFRWTLEGLRALRLSSHPRPELRRENFLRMASTAA
ncbi:hypothetical protein BWI17_14070 [Betaproteobacteria bacterium GR16-43]|nr:hypothetical protein BWI17_14070 [Betaproteobacteria bacterium GR16-43]